MTDNNTREESEKKRTSSTENSPLPMSRRRILATTGITGLGLTSINSASAGKGEDNNSGEGNGRNPGETTVSNKWAFIAWDSLDDEDLFSIWNHFGNHSITEEFNDPALRTEIPEGEHSGQGMVFETKPHWDTFPEGMHVRFEIYLDPDFEIIHQMKLHGIAGRGNYHEEWDSAGWGGRISDGTNGWSVRLALDDSQFDEKLGLEWYNYHADMGNWGDHVNWGVPLERGQWNTIDMYVEMNTPGVADGVVRGWLNGEEGSSVDDMMFREEDYDQIAIDQFWHTLYHGGSDPSPRDNYVVLGNHDIWIDQGPQPRRASWGRTQS